MSENQKFFIQQKNIDDIVVLYVGGYLDAHTAPELEEALENNINKDRKKIIINLRDLNYISSAGLGVFMAFIEDLRENNGDIKFAEMKPKVFSVFDLLGFPMLFDIDNDEKDAITRFSNFKKNEDA